MDDSSSTRAAGSRVSDVSYALQVVSDNSIYHLGPQRRSKPSLNFSTLVPFPTPYPRIFLVGTHLLGTKDPTLAVHLSYNLVLVHETREALLRLQLCDFALQVGRDVRLGLSASVVITIEYRVTHWLRRDGFERRGRRGPGDGGQ